MLIKIEINFLYRYQKHILYHNSNQISPKDRKIGLIKTLVLRALTSCSKNKLGSELDTIKWILTENGYRNMFSQFGHEKCPVYMQIPWIGDISLKYENQIKKAINFCF